MKKSSRIIRNVVVVLSILILSLIAFVGIFVEVDGVYENAVPGLNYGMELSGTRELRYLLSTAEEEKEVYVDDEGNIKTATKLVQFRSLDKLNEIKIPKVKLLNGDMVEYEEYKKMNDENKQLNDLFGDSVVEISNEQLPF